jgi:hypothetical protein
MKLLKSAKLYIKTKQKLKMEKIWKKLVSDIVFLLYRKVPQKNRY